MRMAFSVFGVIVIMDGDDVPTIKNDKVRFRFSTHRLARNLRYFSYAFKINRSSAK